MIPIIYIKKKKIVDDNGRILKVSKEIGEVIKSLGKEYGEVYLVDIDGLEKNKADLNLYGKLSHDSLWIDAGPRFLGDLVDLFVAGASKVTIRWKMMDMQTMREARRICEGKIFLKGESVSTIAKEIGFDGIVVEKENRLRNIDIPIWISRDSPHRLKEMGVEKILEEAGSL